MTVSAAPSAVLPFNDPSRRSRLTKIALWLVGIAIAAVIANLLGIDIVGWFQDLWAKVRGVPGRYVVSGVIFQTGQTVLAGLSYYGILKAAYKDEVTFPPIVTAYAAGVAMNTFLPANLGTLATLLMFVALIPACTFAGAIAAFIVQKIFFTIAGTFVYLYLFLSVPGSFTENFGDAERNPLVVLGIVAGAILLIVILGRIFWAQVKKLWAQAKAGGAILAQPKRYMTRVFLPSFLSWVCKLTVIAIFLAAFAIPVTFESVMWTAGAGSLADVVSVTPGGVGINQATQALALDVCCDVPNRVAIDYSTAQQLITTAWNILFALILVVWVFGWTGGKSLVLTSYEGAKEKAAEQKEQSAAKRQARREARRAKAREKGGNLFRRNDDDGDDESE